MTDDPVDLDGRRGTAEQKSTEIRRQLHEVHADQVSLRQNQKELEELLLTTQAETWPEAAAKAQYLLMLFDSTPEAQEPGRKKLIARTLDDFARLSNGVKVPD